MKTITKSPQDVRRFVVNFSLALPSGVTITNGTVTAKDYSDNDLTGTLIDSVSFTETRVTAFLKGGTNGLRAKLFYTAEGSDSKTKLVVTVPLVVVE